MADREEPLPSLTNIIAAVRTNRQTCKENPPDRSGPQRSNGDTEDFHRKSRGAEEDAQTTRVAHSNYHGCAKARTGPACSLSFTGFRDEDVWRENDDDGDNVHNNPLVHTAGVDATPCVNSLSLCKKLASVVPGVQVESTLTSSTTVLVARRGFTKKRLLAARQGIPVVLPRWVEMGCPRAFPGDGARPNATDGSTSPYDRYAVPWLHGYVFSTTGLSMSERAAIESVCAAHGAVVEPSLTYRCDVLLTRAECVQELQRLLHADQLAYAARRRRNQHLRHAEVLHTDAEQMECSATGVTAPGTWGSASRAAWLTDKIRFALELDVPVVNYTKLFTMLRLDRLPPPTWMPSREALPPESSSKARQLFDDDEVERTRQYAAALNGVDFDALVDVCRVGTPDGGSAEWTRILSDLTDAGEAPATDNDPQRNKGVAEKCDGGIGLTTPLPDGAGPLRNSSLHSLSSSCTDDASTVSDPDAWEDFLSCALASSLEEKRRPQGAGPPTDVSNPAHAVNAEGHFSSNTHTTTTTLPPSQTLLEKLALNIADVEDLGNAETAEPSTPHVFFPDYYSVATGSGVVSHAAPQAGHPPQEALTAIGEGSCDIDAVDESPRLTTNALLHREPTAPRPSKRANDHLSHAQCDGAEAASLGHQTAVYYATHQSSVRLPPQLPHGQRSHPTLAELPQRGLNGGALLAETQVLVGSCVEADQLPSASAQQLDACKTRAPRVMTTRLAVPLIAMHPPYLTICALGCTELELRKTARFSEQCRLLRSPVLTATTDIVVLGSRILTRKRYTMCSSADSKDGEGGTWKGKNQRRLRGRQVLPAWNRGEDRHHRDHASHGVTVTIHYWEMDAAVARTLADVGGIPISRIVPLKWLEDAATEAHKANEAAKLAADSAAAHGSAADHSRTFTGEDSAVDTCWSSATAPPNKLTELLERQLFHPLPPVSPDRLPNPADPKYYIRLRRASIASWTENTSLTAAQTSHVMEGGATLAGLEPPKQVKRGEMHHSVQQVLGNYAKKPGSGITPPLPDDATKRISTEHVSVEEDITQTATALSGVSAPAVCGPSAAAATGSTTTTTEDEKHSHEAALVAAERRFNQLVALLRVSDDHEDDKARVCTDVGGDSRHERAKALVACHFCCMEGDYARVDWAVVRGLIRYGGGRVAKRAAHDWETVLQKQPVVAVAAASGSAHQDQQEKHLALALRRGTEYAKLRHKLTRATQSVENANATNDWTGFGMISGCTGSTCASLDTTEERVAEVARLKAKLQRVSKLCQEAPVLCLLPHSFQRTAVAEGGMPGAPYATNRHREALPGRAGAEAAPPHKRLHVLHRIPAVTMDYILACLAVGFCLNPHSCFLFDTPIPSAPAMRFLHHQEQQRGGRNGGCAPSQRAPTRDTGSQLGLGLMGGKAHEGKDSEAGGSAQAGAEGSGNGRMGRAIIPRCRPALSSWVLERRYSKTDTVGVCISVLWKLPSPSVTEGERCWSRVSTASPSATTTTVEPCLMPDASLVPLLRVLLLGFHNAAEALGGHVADTFSPSAITHVLVVDLGSLLSGTLRDAFTSDVAEKTGTLVDSSGGGKSLTYWPMEGVESIVHCAANDTVSLVGLEWLEACVKWGAFVEETAYTPPPDLLEVVQAEKQRVVLASAQVAQTKQLPPRESAEHSHLSQHRNHLAGSPAPNLPPSSAVMRQATRLVSRLERHPKWIGTPPRGGSRTVAAHTPPSPRPMDYVSVPDRSMAEAEEHDECRTPVERRVPVASETWCDLRAEACTPPLREGLPSANAARHSRQSSPPQLLISPVPPPPGSRMPCRLASGSQSMDLCARSARTPSVGDHAHPHPHRRHSSLSSSQHNTRSRLEQQDADAYVEHLGALFNFSSPGSTPLPSSARRGRERSTTAFAEPDAGTLHRQRNSHQPHSLSQPRPPRVTPSPQASSPPCYEVRRERGISTTSSASEPTKLISMPHQEATLQTPVTKCVDATGGVCDVHPTPRRRTLRGSSAVADAYSSATKRSTLSTPGLQRRRTEELGVVVNRATVDRHMGAAQAAPKDAPCGVVLAAPDVSAPLPQRVTLPNLLGGSTELSRDGNVAELAAGVDIMTTCEETRVSKRQRQGSGCTGNMWVSQTPGDFVEQKEEEEGEQMSSGVATRLAPQHHAHPRSRVTEGDRDRCHPCGQVTPDAAHYTASGEFSWMHDVIPDSQQQHDVAVADIASVEFVGGDVLVPASCVEATAEAYEPTEAAGAETLAGAHHCDVVAGLVLLGDPEEAEHKGGEKAASPAPCAIDIARGSPAPRPLAVAGTKASLVHEALQARPASPSALRQSVPALSASPPSIKMVVDADKTTSGVENTVEDEQRCRTPSVHTGSDQPAHFTWPRHRPLSLSRRPSRSPAPAPSPSHTATRSFTASATAAPIPRAIATTSCTLEHVRIYVLHDLPHRAARIRRCEEALEVLVHRRDGLERRGQMEGGLSAVEPPVKGPCHRGGAGATSRLSFPSSTSQSAPPLCFVARCEDADVLVTHQMSLRESVLVAVVAGCWVVRPGFLECAAAVLDGACRADSRSSPGLTEGRWPTLRLQSPEHLTPASTAAAAETALALCVRRLREALPMYEWTVGMMPCVPASGESLQRDSVPPMLRALVQQCHRQHQIRERTASGSAACGNRGPASVAGQQPRRFFEGNRFVLLFGSVASNAAPVRGTQTVEAGVIDERSCRTLSRVCAIERILETGGGRLGCRVQVGCAAVNGRAETNETTEVIATSAGSSLLEHSPLRCCVEWLPRDGQWHRLLQRRLAPTSSPLVMDVDLYHDLLWLICLEVSRGASETLFVLLDSTLLGTKASSNGSDGTDATVYVSSALHPLVARDALPFSDTCTVASWLYSWLHHSADGETPPLHWGYAPAAARAMRLHLCACCAAVRTVTDDARVPSSVDASYNLADLPFAVPSIKEVREVCAGIVGDRKTTSTMSRGCETVRCIEFRGASWVGACVAAGGSAVMTTHTDAWIRECEVQTRYGTLCLD
ncbi:hypothetical protein JKF63_04150 [Porcisia hertigi]|uniref:BRCT domain-containing protein n=1 Tax=Porcisia hertigi TaxID=2761500 RepID=A0A836IS09_9TRYP|nr:hypothetical protein JKF63_04150 [Porcisia hertigi]